MGKRTLASCLKQFERLSMAVITGSKPKRATLSKLKDLTERVNKDRMGDVLSTLFVRPYIPQPLEVRFTAVCKNSMIPEWQTDLIEPKGEDFGVILIHAPAIYRFIHTTRQIATEHLEEEGEDLLRLRHLSFLVQISKLPDMYIVFLLVLQRVALLLEIAHLEKRGGVIEVAEGEAYHTLLWAFKELELFATRTYGISVRPQFGISWYESEWITGK